MPALKVGLSCLPALVAAAIAIGAGCAPAPANDALVTDSRTRHAEAVRAKKCARCHAPPEAMHHTRAELETIFGRHRARARLTPEEWDAMVDLLARSDETPGPR
ncbi:MAG: hypothetical protein ACRENE_18335 [Polyangiaceae bacterium]